MSQPAQKQVTTDFEERVSKVITADIGKVGKPIYIEDLQKHPILLLIKKIAPHYKGGYDEVIELCTGSTLDHSPESKKQRAEDSLSLQFIPDFTLPIKTLVHYTRGTICAAYEDAEPICDFQISHSRLLAYCSMIIQLLVDEAQSPSYSSPADLAAHADISRDFSSKVISVAKAYHSFSKDEKTLKITKLIQSFINLECGHKNEISSNKKAIEQVNQTIADIPQKKAQWAARKAKKDSEETEK